MNTLYTSLLVVGLLGLNGAVLAETPLTYDRVSLSAAASAEVENDTMSATLFAQERGRNTRELADKVNKEIRWAVDEAKAVQGVKVKTEAYSTQPVYNNSTISGWQVQQNIVLESQDMSAMSELIGHLQSRLKLQGIGFSVSAERNREVEERLTREALDAFTARAILIANQLKHAQYQLVDMNVSGGGAPQYGYKSRGMVMEAMVMSADVAAPAIEAGEATLSINVSGTIELR